MKTPQTRPSCEFYRPPLTYIFYAVSLSRGQWIPHFLNFLAQLDCSSLKVFAQMEGGVVFPRVPLMRIEGPLLVAQLIETPLLTLVNYASLVATNAARHRLIRRRRSNTFGVLDYAELKELTEVRLLSHAN